MTRNEKALWLLKLALENSYQMPVVVDEDHYAAIMSLAWNDTIILGRIGDEYGWDQQWWYETGDALGALLDWVAEGFEGEPKGWHRHIPSNRRREGGDPAKEEVRP